MESCIAENEATNLSVVVNTLHEVLHKLMLQILFYAYALFVLFQGFLNFVCFSFPTGWVDSTNDSLI